MAHRFEVILDGGKLGKMDPSVDGFERTKIAVERHSGQVFFYPHWVGRVVRVFDLINSSHYILLQLAEVVETFGFGENL